MWRPSGCPIGHFVFYIRTTSSNRGFRVNAKNCGVAVVPVHRNEWYLYLATVVYRGERGADGVNWHILARQAKWELLGNNIKINIRRISLRRQYIPTNIFCNKLFFIANGLLDVLHLSHYLTTLFVGLIALCCSSLLQCLCGA